MMKKMMRMTTLLVLVGFICMVGCGPVDDPDEPGIPNERDFKAGSMEQKGANFFIGVFFYANINSVSFWVYIDNTGDGVANFRIICSAREFIIYTHEEGVNGREIHRGPANIMGRTYSFEFPTDVLGISGDAGYDLKYWFLEPGVGDRMPNDHGYKRLLKIV